MVSKEKARIYRQQVKNSTCRKIPKSSCIAKSSCKYANGKIRHFCRNKFNTRRTKYTSSTSGSHPVLQLKELRQIKRPFRIQPVATRRKVHVERGLNDWGSSSSNRMRPVANRRKVHNERGLDDWGSSE